MASGPTRWLHALGLGKPRPDESAALEVEHHLTELTDRLVASGLSPKEARSEAVRRFGDGSRYAAEMRKLEERSLQSGRFQAALELMGDGLRSAGRTMRRQPGFTAAVVVTLGLGIGANATMFGIVERVLLRGPEHVTEPERVVRILIEVPEPVDPIQPLFGYLAYPDIADLRAHDAFEAVAAYQRSGWYVVDDADVRSEVRAQLTSPEMFAVLGVSPILGRFYIADDARPEAEPTIVLSYEYWDRAYGADPDVIGRELVVEGRPPFTIIGVAPRHFTGPELRPVDAWAPLETLMAGCIVSRRCQAYQAVARLRDGASVPAAEAEATALHLAARQETIAAGIYSDRARVILANLIAARGPDSPGESRVAQWLAGVALIVFLVACANVAGLLLARNEQRSRETEVRLALGAGRGRIGVEILFETLALATLGGAFAMFIARWGGELIRTLLMPEVYFPASTLTPRLAWFTLGTTVLAAALAGLAPALRSAEPRSRGGALHSGLRVSASTATVRRALTVVQAAFAVVLLVGAGLFVRSLDRIESLDLGLDVDRLAMAQVTLRNPEMARPDQVALFEDLSLRLTQLPSIESASSTSSGLGSSISVGMRVRGFDSLPRLPGGGPYVYMVPPQYFATGGLEILDGRGFTGADGDGSARVAVVSETMARTLWPHGGAIGGCILWSSRGDECMEIVGVVQDAARNGYFEAPSMAYYLPMTQNSNPPNAIYIRAAGNLDSAVHDATSLLESIPDVRFVRVLELRDVLNPQARAWSLGATMFTAFGVLALVVAVVGLYSLLAFEVAQRTREIGIRSALGARKGRLLGSVVARGMRAGAFGVVLGLGVAYLAAPYLQGLLFETQARDLGVFSVVAVALVAASLLASLIPGLRATRVDPMVALKSD